MIIRKEAYYRSNNGTNMVRALIWSDDEKDPRGLVQIAHGLSEHIGRYDDFARFLAAHGFVVFGNDHLAHGKTAECVSDLGFCCDGDHVNMLKDMNTLHRIMAGRYPGLPYIIFGHSMGSLLARIYTRAFGSEITAAVYCGTAQLPKPVLLLEDPVGFLLDKLPENQNSASGMNSLFGKITMKLLGESDDLAWLSRSTANRERYRADPLCGFNMGPALAKELVALAVKASRPDWAAHLPTDLKVMLISGAKDPVGFNGRGILTVNDLLTAAGIETDLILYPGDRHEILNEDDHEKVYEDIAKFLDKVIADV